MVEEVTSYSFRSDMTDDYLCEGWKFDAIVVSCRWQAPRNARMYVERMVMTDALYNNGFRTLSSQWSAWSLPYDLPEHQRKDFAYNKSARNYRNSYSFTSLRTRKYWRCRWIECDQKKFNLNFRYVSIEFLIFLCFRDHLDRKRSCCFFGSSTHPYPLYLYM